MFFLGLLSEFSAWSHNLKCWCRILCLSVTGKAQNLQKKMGKYMYSIQHSGQFCSAPQAHWVHLDKCVTGIYEKATKRYALLSF